jgi:3'(2'), 5'-bisphosphate nucleotidase
MNINFYDLLKIALEAGKEILEVYSQDFDVQFKEDESPLTLADNRSHHTILKGLNTIAPDIPILSEEGSNIPYSERHEWDQFWLVDPLDGTKEFVKRNGEFTVNIALIEGKYPTIGIIYAPVLDVFYYGRKGKGAYKIEGASKLNITNEKEMIQKSVKLPSIKDHSITRIVASRSHMSEETEAFINELKAKIDTVEVISSGSSLKFCLIAEGKADYYPRFSPTMEWDTAAGQAIVEAAGGNILRYEDSKRFHYNKENLLNGWFLVKK